MSRGIQAFKQTDAVKALKAAKSAGFDVQRFEIDRAGKIVIIIGKPEAAELVLAESAGEPNEWDDVK
jgi:hypothetical protein